MRHWEQFIYSKTNCNNTTTDFKCYTRCCWNLSEKIF